METKNLIKDWLNSISHEITRKKTIDVIDNDDWMANFDFDHSFFDRTKKISFFTFDWIPQKKQHCYHGANSRQKKDLLMKNVSIFCEIATISIQFHW